MEQLPLCKCCSPCGCSGARTVLLTRSPGTWTCFFFSCFHRCAATFTRLSFSSSGCLSLCLLLCVRLCLYLSLFLSLPIFFFFSWLSDHFSSSETPPPLSVHSRLLLLLLWQRSYQRNDNATSLRNVARRDACSSSTHSCLLSPSLL